MMILLGSLMESGPHAGAKVAAMKYLGRLHRCDLLSSSEGSAASVGMVSYGIETVAFDLRAVEYPIMHRRGRRSTICCTSVQGIGNVGAELLL
jgi:hypothetical protein